MSEVGPVLRGQRQKTIKRRVYARRCVDVCVPVTVYTEKGDKKQHSAHSSLSFSLVSPVRKVATEIAL